MNQCKYALITTPEGGIQSDPIVLRLDEDRYWLSTSDCDLELWVRGIAVNSGLGVVIRDAGVSVLQVQGPKAPALMADLFGDRILDLKYYWMTRVSFEDAELVVSRTGWSGEFGYELYLEDATKGDSLFDAIMSAGKPYDVAPGSVSQIRRIESGILSWGADMTPAETPYELGLGHLVELDGGFDFIGKQALTRLNPLPLQRKLVGLTVSGELLSANEDVWPVTSGKAQVGRLTSLSHSPRLKQNIALAIVDAAHAETGTELTTATWDGPRTATVTELPFVAKRQAANAHELRATASA